MVNNNYKEILDHITHTLNSHLTNIVDNIIKNQLTTISTTNQLNNIANSHITNNDNISNILYEKQMENLCEKMQMLQTSMEKMTKQMNALKTDTNENIKITIPIKIQEGNNVTGEPRIKGKGVLSFCLLKKDNSKVEHLGKTSYSQLSNVVSQQVELK
mgnify:CR=1 FL=1